QIRAKILNGELAAGTSLPSIRALARAQHVSVITVQRAYESLLRENLILSRRGKGFFVSELPEKRKKDMARERLLESLKPIILSALEEGVSIEDIQEAIKMILKKNGRSSRGSRFYTDFCVELTGYSVSYAYCTRRA
ncbi:MAG: GntR family transcriptional regulator, partial [Kiloniellaceae bacterium]